jgi:hypothetical protein
MIDESHIVRIEDWPWGLRCMDCDRGLGEGDAFSERLTDIVEGVPLVEVVCLDCALPGGQVHN